MKRLFTLALVFALLLSIGHFTRIPGAYTASLRSGPKEAAAAGAPGGSTTALASTEYSDDDPLESVTRISRQTPSRSGVTRLVPAVVFPADRIRIRAAASGTIRELLVRVGESVSAGQVLSRVRADEVHADLKRRTAYVAAARCRIVEAQADLELAEYERELKEELSLASTVPEAEYVASKLRVRSATARLDAVRQELAMAKHDTEMIEKSLERYRAVAPAAGRVTKILGHVDQYVREGDTILWIESHEKRLKLHLPAERVRGRDPMEVSVLVRGAWRVVGGGVRQPNYNPDGTVTVVFDLGRTDEFVSAQIVQTDAGSGGSVR